MQHMSVSKIPTLLKSFSPDGYILHASHSVALHNPTHIFKPMQQAIYQGHLQSSWTGSSVPLLCREKW